MVMYRSSIVIERMDDIIMEGRSPTISPEDFMAMIDENLTRPIEQVWRVKLLDDGLVDMYSFALPPTEKNLATRHCLNRAAIPDWVNERVSVLQICEIGETVDGVGQKVSEKVYYVIE
jgi:hypothetical protein